MAALTTLAFVAPAGATIIGTDDRYPLTATTTFPYSAVVEITGSGHGRCSGWMYGPDMVATAGHCVYDTTVEPNGWFNTSGMTIWPGRNGSSTPYGGCGVASIYAPSGWTTGQNEAFDYAAIKLNCTIGNSTGWLNYGLQPTVGYQTRICGYPSDKPVDTQWCSDDQIRAVDAYQAYYANDTWDRMSGSPVLGYTSSGWSVMAIHTMPVHGTAPNHSSYNHGTRITSTVSNDLWNWEYYS